MALLPFNPGTILLEATRHSVKIKHPIIHKLHHAHVVFKDQLQGDTGANCGATNEASILWHYRLLTTPIPITTYSEDKTEEASCVAIGTGIIKIVANDNTVRERPHRTLKEKVRCLLYTAGLGVTFRSSALLHAVWLYNQTFHTELDSTPYQMYTGRQPTVDGLLTFGCRLTPKKSTSRGPALNPNPVLRQHVTRKFIAIENTPLAGSWQGCWGCTYRVSAKFGSGSWSAVGSSPGFGMTFFFSSIM
jgi:hypothetical protein